MGFQLGNAFEGGACFLQDEQEEAYILRKDNGDEDYGVPINGVILPTDNSFHRRNRVEGRRIPREIVTVIAQADNPNQVFDEAEVRVISEKIRLVCLYRSKLQEILDAPEDPDRILSQDILAKRRSEELGLIVEKLQDLVGGHLDEFLGSVADAYKAYVSKFSEDDTFWDEARDELGLDRNASKDRVIATLEERETFDRILDVDGYKVGIPLVL